MAMKIRKTVALLAVSSVIAVFALALSACSQQAPPPPAQTAAANQTAMNFDLNKCQQMAPHLYKCPGSDKPICDPAYNKGNVECLKVDANGVLIQVP